ncbi:hypothetical protein LIER_38775 [Lithospermum erythrorhizon]|uniref:Uncharacterized protein n=1 Tax=Lithospermum erythrorhizon TaxID=34254 RepID=A0AAV3Q510_LITER
MKQGNTKHSIKLPMFNQKELEVCDILVDLKNIFCQSIHNYCSIFPNWGIKKKRSIILCGPVASSSSPLQYHHFDVPTIEAEFQNKNKVEDKVEASSPATPLSFSPGESDEKPKHSSKKRGREEWMGIIQELTQSGEILKREVERVRNYFNQLQAHNTELKAWKQEILLKKEEEIKNLSSRNNGIINYGQHFGITTHQQQYFLVNQYHHQYGQLFPSSTTALPPSSSLRQPIGPRGIPDLNLSAEEAFGLDTLQPLDHCSVKITREDPKEKRLIRRIIRTKKRNEQRCI